MDLVSSLGRLALEPTRTCLRTLAFGSIAFAGSGCVSGSPAHGDDSDPYSGDSTSVRWSTFHPDVEGLDVALAPDGSIYVVGVAGYTRQGDSGTYDDWWLAVPAEHLRHKLRSATP